MNTHARAFPLVHPESVVQRAGSQAGKLVHGPQQARTCTNGFPFHSVMARSLLSDLSAGDLSLAPSQGASDII